MNRWRVLVVLTALTTVAAAEPEVAPPPAPVIPEPVTPMSDPGVQAASDPALAPTNNAPSANGNPPAHGNPPVPATHLPDFIVPIACDLRFGYSANVGRYHRSQATGESTDSDFSEHGLWVSHVRALSGPGRVLSGASEWRAEVGLLVSQADVSNPNDSTGTLRSVLLDVGVGPAWALFASDTSRLEIEIMPFVGFGLSRYDNDYTTEISGFRGATSVEAEGFCFEYGIKANLMWCWDNGWGAAVHAGFVQRAAWLEGDSTTRWDQGTVMNDDYTSDDLMTGLRFGLFVAKRF